MGHILKIHRVRTVYFCSKGFINIIYKYFGKKICRIEKIKSVGEGAISPLGDIVKNNKQLRQYNVSFLITYRGDNNSIIGGRIILLLNHIEIY